MKKVVSVVVLGDVGRSPRMQYHALSLAKEGYQVNVVGYQGSEPIAPLAEHENVKFHYVAACPDFKQYLSSTLAYVLKAVWQALSLFLALILAGIPDLVLVQNPPAIPSLGVCYVFARLTRSQLLIDWHNYAHTILAISLGEEARLVRLCRWFEFFFGRRSDKNLCVTRGMKENLMKEHGIRAVTLYDCPPDCFKPTSVEEKHQLLRSLEQDFPAFVHNCSKRETIFTAVDGEGRVSLRPDRPGLLVSSTSWTEDEDFSLLLEALQDYELAKNLGGALPGLVVVITGKGPLKEFYVEVMAKRGWQHIQLITPWLSPEHYPKFLGCADLGVCLHYSSSGLDLPMKIVDMFGCGLPVCAVHFQGLSELLVHKENGLVFSDSTELGLQLQNWFKEFPHSADDDVTWRAEIRRNLDSFRRLRWHENWLLHVKPMLK